MNTHAMLIVATVALVTVLLRVTPFLIFSGDRKTPAYILWLGEVLPYAIMAMLVVYCLKSVDVFAGSHGIPEAISCLVVGLLHLWKRQSLLSICGGTFCYMFLVQMVF